VALALDVAEVLPMERRGPYWQSLCAERWPGGASNYPRESQYETDATDYHKRLYLTYRTIDLLHTIEQFGLQHVEAELNAVEPYVSYIKCTSATAVARAPFKRLGRVETLELSRCDLGRCSTMPGPLENLSDALATGLPRLKSLNLSRNSLADGDVLYLCGILISRRPSIEHLDLPWNRMTNISLTEGIGRLIAETDITHMELGFNDTSPSGRAMCMDVAKRRNKEASTSPSRPKVRVAFI